MKRIKGFDATIICAVLVAGTAILSLKIAIVMWLLMLTAWVYLHGVRVSRIRQTFEDIEKRDLDFKDEYDKFVEETKYQLNSIRSELWGRDEVRQEEEMLEAYGNNPDTFHTNDLIIQHVVPGYDENHTRDCALDMTIQHVVPPLFQVRTDSYKKPAQKSKAKSKKTKKTPSKKIKNKNKKET
jgi:hypothetical protein